jgi:TetR/AcrR family transcriptional repressor of nem operon
MSTQQAILEAARRSAQLHGYGGLNIRNLADEVGIKAASIYHHFPSKAELGAAVAARYWQDTEADLRAMAADAVDATGALHRYPQIFRRSLESENRLCLASFMSAEYDDLPPPVQIEVLRFADVNIAWLSTQLVEAGIVGPSESEARARAIFAAVAGAQLVARSRADMSVFDTLITTYRDAGLVPA